MRALVVGAGAVGGYFGALLTQAGADMTFLVRGSRLAQLTTRGLRIAAVGEPATAVPVATVTADTLDRDYDLILLAIKGTALTGALADLGPAIGESTAVLPLLNGIRHLDMLRDQVGASHVLGGVSLVATELGSNGVIQQVSAGASIAFGELNGRPSPRTAAISNLFTPAAFDSRVSDSIVQEMWEKWFFMAAGGAATVLLGAPAGTITAVGDGLAVVRQIIDETAAVIAAEAHPVRPAAFERVATALTAPGSPFATSLYRDFRAGRSTEVEPILGDLIRRAAAHGLSTPLLTAATVRLRVHEAAVAA